MTPDEKEDKSAKTLIAIVESFVVSAKIDVKDFAEVEAEMDNQNPEDHKAAATAIIHRAIELSDCGIVRAILKEALK